MKRGDLVIGLNNDRVTSVAGLVKALGAPADGWRLSLEREGQVLAGAAALIARDRPAIFLELHPHLVPRFGHSIDGILGELAKTYTDIRLFERREHRGGFLAKIAVRYFGANGLREIADAPAYVRHYSRDMTPHTFWAVCRP